MDNKQNSITIGCLCAIACEVLYGMSYMFTKQATDMANPFALLGWRFLLSTIMMSILAFIGAIKINLTARKIKSLLLVSLFCPCIYFMAETFGIRHTTSSESGVLLACIPAFSLITSAIILRKYPTKFQILGILISLIGVTITVFAVGTSASFSLVGYMLLMTAVLSYSIYGALVDKASEFSSLEITYVMLIAGAVLFVILAMVEAMIKGKFTELIILPFAEKKFLKVIVYQGIVCSVIAFFLSNMAISRIGLNRTASFIGISTVVSILAGALVLQESFTVYQMVGAIVIIIGVYVANFKANI